MKTSHNLLLKAWYGKSFWVYVLLPLSWLFYFISNIRKFVLVRFFQQQVSVPVVIVGNISVGGTGKTPLIIELVKYLQDKGHKPGVVSRGYGGKAPHYPFLLNEKSLASESGDEPLLISRSTGCCVCVSPDRVAAAKVLIEAGCTIILSDDGMQHYVLGRQLEIAVVDGQRLFGNQHLLPVGPLREPVSRLNNVDLIVVNNPGETKLMPHHPNIHAMNLEPVAWRNIAAQKEFSLDAVILMQPVHAVAGIGNPQRFFKTLDSLSISFNAHPFPDHHTFSPQDFSGFNNGTVVMTEKDAVKCQAFAKPDWYSLVVGARLNEHFWSAFQQKLDAL
ncbi:tetraacyldisaccharide 4'-kinase [Cellvibrio sp.]|uniref:tetraacyldisaccharide 4'-kinase n=1 Tax=Cellvibrio sp. TaxID=1965322 RepID=UPI00396479F8